MIRHSTRKPIVAFPRAAGVALAALAAMLLSGPPAAADRGAESDPRGDASPPFTDLRAVWHGHARGGVLRHVLLVQDANAASVSLAQLEVSDGRRRYLITSRGVTRIGAAASDVRAGGARVTRSGNRIVFSFHRSLIGNPRRYAWAATIGSNDTGPSELDRAPDEGALPHTLRRPPRFIGYRAGPDGKPDRAAVQGDGHSFVLLDRARRRVPYMLVLDGPGDARKGYRGRTNRRGRDAIEASLYVNDVGGPGAWRAIWRVGKRNVAVFRFRLRPEPEG